MWTETCTPVSSCLSAATVGASHVDTSPGLFTVKTISPAITATSALPAARRDLKYGRGGPLHGSGASEPLPHLPEARQHLFPAAGFQQAGHLLGDPLRRRVLLDQLGHDFPPGYDVGQHGVLRLVNPPRHPVRGRGEPEHADERTAKQGRIQSDRERKSAGE